MPVIDPAQLKRIQAMHRGFLYQHLYAVGTVLLAGTSGLTALTVEKDEDIELELPEARLYVQTKTRNRNLEISDVEEAVQRFQSIREAHSSGARQLIPNLWLISNVDPSEALKKEMAEWPPDVFFRSPNFSTRSTDTLPPAWKDLPEALAWCIELAGKVPFGSLPPETLVWKLAGIILFSSTAEGPRQLKASDLPELLEQLVVQLHRFPIGPRIYRPHDNEPDFNSFKPVRLVVGFSGAGKTTWASEGSVHSGQPVAYFDVGDMPTAAVAPSLARELAAVIMHDRQEEVRRIMLPGGSGLQSLRAINQFIQEAARPLIVVLDNAHRIDTDELTNIIRVTPAVRWILLAQPWPGKAILEAKLEIKTETLQGWSVVEIAGEFSDRGCQLAPGQAEEVRRLTGGLPLYVQSAARIAKDYYQGHANNFLEAINSLTHHHGTGQEAILRQVEQHLSQTARDVASLLAVADIPLVVREAISLLSKSFGYPDSQAAASLRELEGWGVVETLRDGRITMHDAYRILAQQAQGQLAPDLLLRAKKHLIQILMTGHGVDRFRLLCKLLPQVGETEALVDAASGASEYFHEYGMSQEFEAILRSAAESPDLNPSDKFWALDTTVYWNLQIGNIPEAEANLAKLERHIATFEPSERQLQALAMKRMLLAGRKGNRQTVEEQFTYAAALSKSDEEFNKILRYNYAVCLLDLREYDASAEIAFELVKEYFVVLGLTPKDVVLKNIPEILPKLKKTPADSDDIKHLADALDLHAAAICRAGHDSRRAVLPRMTAFKFFVMANALGSAVRVGKDIVDGLLEFGDAIGARHFIESTMLPLLSEGKLLDEFVPIHSQYAVVLAYCGEFEAAKKTMRELSSFLIASPEYRFEFENQRRLIRLISEGLVSLPSSPPQQLISQEGSRKRKIGRNEPCPCGSGQKYKRCCGQ